MRMKTVLSSAFAAVMLSAPAWSHHAAQGIVSDEVWDSINEQLLAVDSPHLNIDFDDVMGTMDAVEIDGRMFLETSITVTDADAAEYVDLIEQAVDRALGLTAEEVGPDGLMVPVYSNSFDIEVVPREDDSGYVDIFLLEPIGQGASQVEPPAAPPPQSGKR